MTFDELVTLIDSGTFDDSLPLLAAKINDRTTAVRKTRTVDDFHIGDLVRINDYCGTPHLRGATAVVIGRARTKLTITLDKPVGRFVQVVDGISRSVDIKVPPSIVDVIR